MERLFLLTPLREGRLFSTRRRRRSLRYFYSRPCGRGDQTASVAKLGYQPISTHAPAGGATDFLKYFAEKVKFLLTPLREGRRSLCAALIAGTSFLLTPLREGRPSGGNRRWPLSDFYSRPCGRGDSRILHGVSAAFDFYSRPCGRGDGLLPSYRRLLLGISTHAPAGGATAAADAREEAQQQFLLTPLREGRPAIVKVEEKLKSIFLLTPLREGRPRRSGSPPQRIRYFYSRPCGRGDALGPENRFAARHISTHAPAGGATQAHHGRGQYGHYFYSRPCGRGDRR